MTPEQKVTKYFNENYYKEVDVDKLNIESVQIGLKEQAKKIKKLFTQHCDGCSMCPTCMSEFDERFLK